MGVQEVLDLIQTATRVMHTGVSLLLVIKDIWRLLAGRPSKARRK